MSKRILILAVARLLAAALTVGAASVTPSAATNYIFTTPLFPDSIRGEVMGDPLAYFDPRGEDIDWLFEAFMERQALINGRMWDQRTHPKPSFGEWPLAYTNNFYTWSTAVDANGNTNIVVGYNLVTNAPWIGLGSQDVKLAYDYMASLFTGNKLGYQTGLSKTRYLDVDAPLLDSPRVMYDWPDPPAFTNVTISSTRKTSQTVTNVSYISMPMTNGTTSVFTNRWTATYYHPATNYVTNVVTATALDYCHANSGAFPGFPNETATWSTYRDYRDGDLSIMYDALRAAVRLSDTTSPTNETPYVHKSYTTLTSTGNDWTNSSTTASYYISAEHDWTEYLDEDDNIVRVDHIYKAEDEVSQYESISPTRFRSDLVTAGETVRVEIEAAFAVVEFTYEKGHYQGSEPHQFVMDNIIHKLVVIPLASPSLDLSHTNAIARVTLNAKSLCAQAATASGVPAPPDYGSISPPAYESNFWSAECRNIVLIYRTHPSSMFTDWL